MSFDFHLSHWGCVPGLVGNMPAETTVRRSSRDMARSCWRPARSMQHHAAWKTRKILRHLKSVKEMEQRHPILSWIYNNKSKKYVGQCGPWDSLVWGIQDNYSKLNSKRKSLHHLTCLNLGSLFGQYDSMRDSTPATDCTKQSYQAVLSSTDTEWHTTRKACLNFSGQAPLTGIFDIFWFTYQITSVC